MKQPDPDADSESDESVFDYSIYRSDPGESDDDESVFDYSIYRSLDDDDNGNDDTAEETSGDFVLKHGDTAVS